jgi:hypothetical protein
VSWQCYQVLERNDSLSPLMWMVYESLGLHKCDNYCSSISTKTCQPSTLRIRKRWVFLPAKGVCQSAV